MAVVGVAGKPLRLKDFLELDCDSCSAAGFRCYPRRLCVPAPAPVRQGHQLQLQPSLRPKLSHISIARSLSRRLRVGFSWRRHEEETSAAVVSSSEPSAPPEVVAAGSSSDSETSESGSSTSSAGTKSESDFSSVSSDTPPACTAAAADVHEVMERGGSKEAAGSGSGSEGDDKEQLSPVGVMDFPLGDDDDDDDDDISDEEEGRDAAAGGAGACSPSFSDSLAQLQRRKTQLQRKIRRLRRAVDRLGAVDLEARFAASDPDGHANVVDPEAQQQLPCCANAAIAPSCLNIDVHGSVDVYGDRDRDVQSLHELLMATAPAVGVDGATERLLLDFFAERAVPNVVGSWESGSKAAVRLAKGWLEGTGPQWGLNDVLCCREDLVAGMERSRRWSARAVDEEERMVGVVVAGLVVDELVGELLRDLPV